MRILAFILTLSLLCGCFWTRQPETPDSDSGWISPTTYEQLLDNFIVAVQAGNVQNYNRCLAPVDLYRFTPTPSEYNGHESVWDNWRRDDEQTYLTNIKDQIGIAGIQLQLIKTDLQNVTADSLKYVGNYTLSVPHTDSALTTVFKGQLSMILRFDGAEWSIKQWTDIETHPDSSWSRLKRTFIQ